MNRRGWTLIEMIFALALFGVLSAKLVVVISSASNAATEQPSSMILEDKANQVLDQIAMAIMSSDRETLIPGSVAPIHLTSLRYSLSLGLDGAGEVIWSDPEEIGLGAGEVIWRERPDQVDERRMIWSKLVEPFMEGEIPNGVDDNGNGLIDEQGLNFLVEKNKVTVRLTLGRRSPVDGMMTTRTVQTVITCRNNPR